MTGDAGHGTDARALIEEARRLLLAAPGDRDAPYRYPILATVDGQGGANARTLILRSFEARSWTLTLHTDRRSAKISEIAKSGAAMLVFYDHVAGLQVRLRGSIYEIEDETERSGAWASLPESNSRNYRASAAPGTPLPAPRDGIAEHSAEDGFANFAVLTVTPETVDILRLAADGNRRYRLDPDTGAGTWLVP